MGMPTQDVSIWDDTGTNAAGIDTNNAMSVLDKVANSLVPAVFDYVALSYTGNNVTGIVYKIGGASGTIVSTLTITYSGDKMLTVTKS